MIASGKAGQPAFFATMMKLITPPTYLPLTPADVKLWARIDTDAMDGDIEGLILAAMNMAEHECGMFFREQVWRLSFETWPDKKEMLRVHEPLSVEVRYKLTHDAPDFTLLPAADYVVAPRFMGFSIVPTRDNALPEIENELGDHRVQIDVTVGADLFPAEVLLYIKTQCAWWIRNPEAVQDGKFVPGPFIAQMLHGSKVWWM